MGSTGSIGKSTLQVVRHLKSDLKILALAAKSNISLLEEQAHEFHPKLIAVFEKQAAKKLQEKLPHIPVVSGMEGLEMVAAFHETDFTMLAMAGNAGLIPAIAAINAGKQIGLANKEVMVSAGELIHNLVKEKKVELIPVDSEHNALFQCMQGENPEAVRRLILTASGGPFKDLPIESLKNITKATAMQHPNFRMGPKVTIDSSTLMNKGLEMIEAKWLFGIAPDKIEAVIHPEQRIHSCVEFIDGSMLAQMSEPDMVLPIQYALTYPERRSGILPKYDFMKTPILSFFPPDLEKFRCLDLALQSMKEGKSYPCFLNAANEVLVDRFLKEKISWLEIGTKLEKLISSHSAENLLTLEAVLEVDRVAREKASTI